MIAGWRLFWLLVLGFHTVSAGLGWWLLPGGFPASHPRFWSNTVAPLVVLTVVIIAVQAARRDRLEMLRATLLTFPAAWTAAAVVSRLIFPVTFARLFGLPLFGAALMGAGVLLGFRSRGRTWRWGACLAVVAAGLFGASLPLTQRAPAADTRPLNSAMPGGPVASGAVSGGELGRRVLVHPGDGSLTMRAGGLKISVQPLLRFLDRSPDKCLTILAPAPWRDRPDLHVTSSVREGNRVDLHYRADHEASLRVELSDALGPVTVEAMARLEVPFFSHLNTFCDLMVTSAERLSLEFSPCPGTRVEVRPADYPVGRPLRFAYRDDRDRFHIVEASTGEKGPFRELATGRLRRTDSLGMTLHDGDTAVLRITFEDWAAQTGTTLSPTAGWGVPVNAIEFSKADGAENAPSLIFFTLAGTSVGRGWDSVGHAPGVYRNRMTIEDLTLGRNSGSITRGRE